MLTTTGGIIAGITILTIVIRPSTHIHLSIATGAIITTGTVITILMVPGLSW